MPYPSVTFGDQFYYVHKATVRLTLNSGPLLCLQFEIEGNQQNTTEERLDIVSKRTQGTFSFQDDEVEFITIGFNQTYKGPLEVVGLVLQPSLVNWFGISPSGRIQNNVDYLVYQRQTLGDGWEFLNHLLGRKFSRPPNIDLFERLFPVGSCLWRSAEFDNFQFLNQTIALLSRLHPLIRGWSGFYSESKPLRLITFNSASAVELDSQWGSQSHFLPNRYGGAFWSAQPCILDRYIKVQEDRYMSLIKHLVSSGIKIEDHQFLEGNEPAKLLVRPGTVKIGDRIMFCQTITYEFQLYNQQTDDYDDPSEAKLTIETCLPNQEIGGNVFLPLRLEGDFQQWYKKEGENNPKTQISLKPNSSDNWRLMSEQDPMAESDNSLQAKILSPTSSRKNFSGIYIKHKEGDRMIMDIRPFNLPLVIGSLQRYQEQLENADISIGGEKLAISVSPHSTDLEQSQGFLIDQSRIKGQAKERLALNAEQNVSVESDQLNVKAETTINKGLNIKGETTLESGLEVQNDTHIDGDLSVGSM